MRLRKIVAARFAVEFCFTTEDFAGGKDCFRNPSALSVVERDDAANLNPLNFAASHGRKILITCFFVLFCLRL